MDSVAARLREGLAEALGEWLPPGLRVGVGLAMVALRAGVGEGGEEGVGGCGVAVVAFLAGEGEEVGVGSALVTLAASVALAHAVAEGV